MMFKKLQNIFSDVNLTEIDNLKELDQSHLYKKFLRQFPNLSEIFEMGIKRDRQEFIRTIRHIFRSIKIYTKLLDKTFSYDLFSEKTITSIYNKIKKIESTNHLFIALILIYHDIGKFVRKRDHPQQSFVLISDRKLLSPFKLERYDHLLIEKVIQYHILFATIFTGESTHYGSFSLINDLELTQLISDNKYLDLFVDLLEIFTFIDILGYSYSQIFDHYLIYYELINQNLKDIFKLLPNKEKAIQKAFQHSQEWIDWRSNRKDKK